MERENSNTIVEVTQSNMASKYIQKYEFYDYDDAVVFAAAARKAVKTDAVVIGSEFPSCGKCKFWEFIDTKSMIGGSFDWGYCHKLIDRSAKDEESLFDLSEYFQKEENEFCSSYERKEDRDDKSV